jgi:uncharacterized membrane protein
MSAKKFQLQERKTMVHKKYGRTILSMILFLLFFAGIQPGFLGKISISAAGAAEITYPEKSFDNGKAQHFTYKAPDGLAIRYFVLRSSDGVIRAAFDACDVCWPAGKGYYQKGDFMVCRNCGRQFRSTRVNEVQGGCNPAPLNRKIANGKVVIQTADILQGRMYFDLSKGGKK